MSCKTIYVMISSFLSEEEKMIVAAHELGHIILHRSQLKMAPMQDDTLYNMTDNTEYQANLFAFAIAAAVILCLIITGRRFYTFRYRAFEDPSCNQTKKY